jgi:hypothetical protein
MNKLFFAVILSVTAVSAGASNWPWDNTEPQQPPQYCMGFVVGGLASNQVSGMSRTDLWLAWSYVIRSGALEQTVDATQSVYQQGREKFQNVADNAAATSIVQNADGDCGLGRSGLQITGW